MSCFYFICTFVFIKKQQNLLSLYRYYVYILDILEVNIDFYISLNHISKATIDFYNWNSHWLNKEDLIQLSKKTIFIQDLLSLSSEIW